MAQSGYTPILIYASGTTGNTPSASNLTSSTSGAELALNYYDGKLFYKDNSGTVQVLATKGTGPIGGSNTQVQYNSSGALAGSANLTFDGTTLTANTLSVSTSTTTPIVQSSGSLLLKTNGTTTAVTIDTSQNVGIGISPSQKLSVLNSASVTGGHSGTLTSGSYFYLRGDSGSSSGQGSIFQINANYGLDTWIYNTNTSAFITATTLDVNGNLGLGVTPSAWTNTTVLEFTGGNWLGSNNVGLYAGSNNYYYSGFKYKTTAASTYYAQASGQHQWYTAPSGTAGTAITFTQAMTLTNSGQLLLGTTSPGQPNTTLTVAGGNSGTQQFVFQNTLTSGSAYVLQATLGFSPNNTTSRFLTCGDTGGDKFYIYSNGTYATVSDATLKKNIVTTRDGYLADLNKLRVVKYNWANHEDSAPKELGFIAQEIEEIFPNLIDNSGTHKVVKQPVFIPMLIKAIQELSAQVTALQAKVGV